MLQIATELAKADPPYADMALKFITHFRWIAVALNPPLFLFRGAMHVPGQPRAGFRF
jgi:hypothetical protein